MQSSGSDRARPQSTPITEDAERQLAESQSRKEREDAAARKQEYDATEPLDLDDPEEDYES